MKIRKKGRLIVFVSWKYVLQVWIIWIDLRVHIRDANQQKVTRMDIWNRVQSCHFFADTLVAIADL